MEKRFKQQDKAARRAERKIAQENGTFDRGSAADHFGEDEDDNEGDNEDLDETDN
jgi:hypothetical protein